MTLAIYCGEPLGSWEVMVKHYGLYFGSVAIIGMGHPNLAISYFGRSLQAKAPLAKLQERQLFLQAKA